MAIYWCKVLDREGRRRDLTREAASEEILLRELNRENIYPVEVREVPEAPGRGRGGRPFSRRRYSSGAVQEFTATMAMLLSSGLTFRDALELAQTIFLKGEINEMIVRLLEEIEKGRSVHAALDRLESGFPPIFRGFVRIGERIGSLDGAFQRLSEYLGEQRRLREKLVGSMIYPLMVLGVAVVGITGITAFVLPRIRQMFEELGSALPARLQAVAGMVETLQVLAAAAAGAALAAALAVALLRRGSEAFAESLDRWALKVPLWGRLRYLREILNLTFAVETLTGGGFPVEDALQEAGSVVQNRAVRAGIRAAWEKVLKGQDLSRAFLDNPIFPKRVGRWIAVGERSGQVAPVFAQLHRYYQGEVERWSSRFMTLVEPVLIVLVGVIVFLFILFFITPIFSIYEGLV